MLKADMKIRLRELLSVDASVQISRSILSTSRATTRPTLLAAPLAEAALPGSLGEDQAAHFCFPDNIQYLIKQGFSQVLYMKSNCNRLDASGALRLKPSFPATRGETDREPPMKRMNLESSLFWR